MFYLDGYISYLMKIFCILGDKIRCANPQSIVDKLISKFSKGNNIDIITETIHGLQGDECDMIINLLNPPPYIGENENIFLNKKNILNVSISRAKDYLILLLPYDDTRHIATQKLFHIEKIKDLIFKHSSIAHNCQQFSSDEIETIIFEKKGMIEEFSFPTSHQSVNVYANPDKKYEIRYDENAIDIQLRLGP